MEIRNYIAILWRRKWVVAVTVAVTVIITVVGTLMATPTYVASTTLRFLTAPSGSVDWVDYEIGYAQRLMNTYVKIATSRPVLEELMQQLGLNEPPKIELEILPNTELMHITVEDPNPTLARDAANALAGILIAQSRELYTGSGKTAREVLSEQLAQIEEELTQARSEYDSLIAQLPEGDDRIAAASRSIEVKQATYAALVEQYEQVRVREAMRANMLSVVEPAVDPQPPSKTRQALKIVMGFMVGLTGGVGLAFLFENLDTTLYTTEQIAEAAALSALGKIPTTKSKPPSAFFNGNSPQGEAFRRLRTNVLVLDHDVPLRTLLVTSAEPREGKSTVVANLAFAIAQSGRKVILVDGDLRLPTLHKIFGLSNEIGLSSVLKQEVTLDEAVQDSHISGVRVLTSGPLPLDPAELLGSSQMTALIKQLAQQFDVVLLDAPSLLAVSDAVLLASIVDGVLLIVGRAQARKEAVQAACQHLADANSRPIGFVVNRAKQDGSYNYYSRSPTGESTN
jgi:capsular exopolysaccharide synthesis family protein